MTTPGQKAAEWVKKNYPDLSPGERQRAINAYLAGSTRAEVTKPMSYAEIIDRVFKYLDLDIGKAKTGVRKCEYVYARYLCFYLGRETTDLSLSLLGEYFDRDHSTALYGIKRISDMLTIYPYVERDIGVIIK